MKKFLLRKNPTDTFSAAMLAAALLFYLFFACWDGPFLTSDSPTYIGMYLQREPLYPLFLAFFRWLVPGGTFREFPLWMQVAIMGQAVLTALAAWSLPRFLYRRLHLPKFVALALLCMPFAVSLLTRFGAGRQSLYSNSILSEALAIPLYLLLLRFLFSYLVDGAGKDLFCSCLLSFLMISTRKQMIVSLLLIVLVLFYKGLRPRRLGRAFINVLLAACTILCAVFILDRGYNYCLYGQSVGHSGDSRFLTTMVCYTAKEEDAARIADENCRRLFLEIYHRCQRAGYLKDSAGKGWYNRVDHFGDHYDHIQIDTLWPMVDAYAKEVFPNDPIAWARESDRIMDVITQSLFPACFSSIAGCFFDNLLSGLVTTVALRRPLLLPVTFVLYLGYLCLLGWLTYKKNSREIILFSALTLVSILVNVSVVSAVIFCQSRYTIYNMPLFYMSGVLMLWEAFSPKKA